MSKQTFRIGKNFIPNILVSSCSVILLLFASLILVAPVAPTTNAEPAAPAENGTSLVTSKTIEATIHPEGESTLSIIKDTIVGSTSSQYGYEIFVSANSDEVNDIYLNGSAIHDEANQKIIATTGTFAAPTALDITNGATWGYAIAGLGDFDADYNIYTPSDTAKFAAMPTMSNAQLIHDVETPSADDELDIYYGIKVNSDLEPGIYKTEILYTVIPRTTRPCHDGICYESNGGDGSMSDQAVAINEEITLDAPKFSRAGFGFAGWNTAADGTGTMYGPNETITMPADSLRLYAIWIEPEQNVTMQTFDKTVAPYASAANGTVIALRDERDNQVYTVAKLADGEWWMTENLRLDISVYGDHINANNTNNPTSDFLASVATKPASATSGWCINTIACINGVQYNTGNIGNQDEDARYSYGAYYNWYTATAGNGLLDNSQEINNDNYRVKGDICPAGWHLGVSGVGGVSIPPDAQSEFYNLNYAINGNSEVSNSSAALRTFPNNFVYSGGMFQNNAVSANDRGVMGSYAASNATSNSDKAAFDFYDGAVLIGSGPAYFKGYGSTVRCIANDAVTYTISYDANGGNGAPSSQSNTNNRRSATFTISDTVPTLSDYNLIGWSTNQNATAAEYQPGDEITLDGSNNTATLYAIWGRTAAKAILGRNGNLNFIYDYYNYTAGETYTDNLGSTEIYAVYDVPVDIVVTSYSNQPQWTRGSYTVNSVNFSPSFYDFEPTSTMYWFAGLAYLGSITNAENLNTSNVTNMSNMFSSTGRRATAIDFGNIGSWDVSRVTDMSNMFAYAGQDATTWSIGDLSNWNVGSVTDMSWMFSFAGYHAPTFNLGNLGYVDANHPGWNVGNVANMSHMFYEAGFDSATFDLGNIGSWDVSDVTDMSYMFQYAGKNSTTWSIGNLGYVDTDHPGWNVGNVATMSYMFEGTGENASTWNIGNISSWNVSSVTNMVGMFRSAGLSATDFDLGNLDSWNVSIVTNMSGMFKYAGENATTWNIGDISGWTVTNVANHGDFIDFNANSTNASVVNNQPNWQ